MQTSSVSLGTLTNQTGILRAGPVVTRGGKVISARAALAIRDLATTDGPWLYGIMAGDLTLTELEAYLELQGPLTPADRAGGEITTRGKYIRTLGIMGIDRGPSVFAGAFLDNRSLTGLLFAESGDGAQGGWDWWLYNLGVDMTTGATLTIVSQLFCHFNPSG